MIPEAAGCSQELFCQFFPPPKRPSNADLRKNHPNVQSGDKSAIHLLYVIQSNPDFWPPSMMPQVASWHKAESSTLPLTLDSLSSGTRGHLLALELASSYVPLFIFLLISSLSAHSAPQVCLFMCWPVRVFQCSWKAPSSHNLPSRHFLGGLLHTAGQLKFS